MISVLSRAKTDSGWAAFIGDYAELVFAMMAPKMFRRLAGHSTKYLRFIPSISLHKAKRTVGELDLVAVTPKGMIVAVFEVKASLGLARKAVSQMRKVKKYFQDVGSLTTSIGKKKISFPYTVSAGCQYYTAHLIRCPGQYRFFVQKIKT